MYDFNGDIKTTVETLDGKTVDQLRSIYEKARGIVINGNPNLDLTPSKYDVIVLEDIECLAKDIFMMLPKHMQTLPLHYAYIALCDAYQCFSKTHYQITPETLDWGGFMSHDTFCTFDDKGWGKALEYIMS